MTQIGRSDAAAVAAQQQWQHSSGGGTAGAAALTELHACVTRGEFKPVKHLLLLSFCSGEGSFRQVRMCFTYTLLWLNYVVTVDCIVVVTSLLPVTRSFCSTLIPQRTVTLLVTWSFNHSAILLSLSLRTITILATTLKLYLCCRHHSLCMPVNREPPSNFQ